MRRYRTTRAGWISAFAAIMCVIGACDGGPQDVAERQGTSSTIIEDPTPWAQQTRRSSRGPLDPRRSLDRLDELVGTSTERLLEQRDEAAYDCLAERGFDFERTSEASYVPPNAREITNGEFAQQWGFGVSTAIENALELMAVNTWQLSFVDRLDSHGIPHVPLVAPREQTSDAFRALSAELNGGEGVSRSCTEVANDDLDLIDSGPFYASTELRRTVLYTYDNSEDLAALNDAYRRCMNDQGFDEFDSPRAAFEDVEAEYLALAEPFLENPASFAGTDALSSQDQQALGRLQQRERSVAMANLGCEPAFTPAALALIDDVQRDVLAANKALVLAIQEG